LVAVFCLDPFVECTKATEIRVSEEEGLPKDTSVLATSCCLPEYWTGDYDYFTNVGPVVAFKSHLYYSKDVGMRIDISIWNNPASTVMKVYYLKAGTFYLYNMTSNQCSRTECPGCFRSVCIGPGSPFHFKANVSVGTQAAQKWVWSPDQSMSVEITLVPYNSRFCLPINELLEAGIYLEPDTTYGNGFYSNIRVFSKMDPLIFSLPPACLESSTVKSVSNRQLKHPGGPSVVLPFIF
jgi:hypothetical protein